MDYGKDMKNFLNIVLIISLAQVSYTAHASEITSIYTTGDVLTAATLDTIKNAVNDNDTRLDTMARVPYFVDRPPDLYDDFNDPYPVGTIWVDTSSSSSDVYISIDSSGSAAIWKQISPSVYALGDTGPGGGLVFHVTADGLHGLEVTKTDLSTSSVWGCESQDIARAKSTAIGMGQINTVEILQACTDALPAQVMAGHTANGFYDWFLPSKDELNQIFCVFGSYGGTTVPSFCSGLPLSAHSFGNNTSVYWSSSQSSGTAVWGLSFDEGSSAEYLKTNQLNARAVREF